MSRISITLLSLALMTALAGQASATEGNGNSENPSQAVPNTGGVSGGPNHHTERGASATAPESGKPVQAAKDGHTHTHAKTHTHDKK
ncbi:MULTISPECIES: hypothetical protein [unclassified Methylobacterium]|uniref:hypothetical protein n=1 Tax=unclassified Methylobacterium TaxID=2615210 RepID=UPI0007012D89|nr:MULTISPECIES: hypothetical protein [unclassified Methylobacterium]KQO68284.1 hypothetical protein ASF18_07575 [Methylobacterium sp. Leaf89]KQO70180.1 hypothetical protein ASF20_20760 [Methylobacterium sp. Leaf88]KQT76622.1 hypothetical protein ASG51_07025 [Methylobacterium sp. Leaf465]